MHNALPALFDAHLHPAGLSDVDLETMRLFGVVGAVATASFPAAPKDARAVLERFDELTGKHLRRLEKMGIRGYLALGVPPDALPRRGLAEVLSALPGYFRGGRVVAIGPIGLDARTEVEEEAFLEQLALARRLKLPVLMHTPRDDHERAVRRSLELVQQSRLAAAQLLVDEGSARAVRLGLEWGHWAALTVHPDALSTERAVLLVRKMGSRHLLLSSHAGEGASDLLGMPRVASRLARGGLSERLVGQLAFDNAVTFFRLDRREL